MASTLIVGAGPTGLTLACELLRRGVPCRIIDKMKKPPTLSKALGVNATSLFVFQQMWIVNNLIAEGLQMQDVEVFWHHRRFVHADYRHLKNTIQYPFVLHLHQPDTERHLTRLLEHLGGKIERGVSINELSQNEHHVTVMLQRENDQQEEINFQEVIGCDGSQSTVRQLLNIDFSGIDYGYHFIYADVEVEGTVRADKIRYYANNDDLLIIIPTPKNIYRVVGLVPGAKDQRPQPTLSDLQYYVDRVGPGNLRLKNPTQLGSVPLYYRLAETNRVGRVFLAGDAFHLFSPIGGQGMNTGIQDAYNLAWKLAYVKKGLAQPALLDSYITERLTLVKKLIKDIDKMMQMIIRKDKEADDFLKAIAPTFANRNMLRKNLPRQFSGFNYCYELGDCIKQNSDVMPNEASAGEYVKELEKMTQQPKHTLFIYSDMQQDRHKAILFRKIKTYIQRHYEKMIDIRQSIAAASSRISLVRPDGYIGYQGKLEDFPGLKNYLAQWYIGEATYA